MNQRGQSQNRPRQAVEIVGPEGPAEGECHGAATEPRGNGIIGLRSAVANIREEPWLSAVCTQGQYSQEIFEQMARTFWVCAWADLEDECGDGIHAGADAMDLAPETPDACRAFALEQASALCGKSGVANLGELLLRAAAADGLSEEGIDVARIRRKWSYAEDFGHCMAMEIMGTGVAWTDDHEAFACADIHAEYSSMDASEILADGAVERLGKLVSELRAEGRTILDLADLPPVEELLRPGVIVAEGEAAPGSGERGIPTAEVVFLKEKLGLFEALHMGKAEQESVLDHIPWRREVMNAMGEADPEFRKRIYVLEPDESGEGSVLRFKIPMASIRLVSGEFDAETMSRLPIEVSDWSAADHAVGELLSHLDAPAMTKVGLEVVWATGEVTPWTMAADKTLLFQDVKGELKRMLCTVPSETTKDFDARMGGDRPEALSREAREFLETHHIGF